MPLLKENSCYRIQGQKTDSMQCVLINLKKCCLVYDLHDEALCVVIKLLKPNN